MGKKKDKIYHLVLTLEDETTLQSSDLVINDTGRAQGVSLYEIQSDC